MPCRWSSLPANSSDVGPNWTRLNYLNSRPRRSGSLFLCFKSLKEQEREGLEIVHVNRYKKSNNHMMLFSLQALFGSFCTWIVSFYFLAYLIPHIFVATFYRTKNLKKSYNATWGLVTGSSSGACAVNLCALVAGACPVTRAWLLYRRNW